MKSKKVYKFKNSKRRFNIWKEVVIITLLAIGLVTALVLVKRPSFLNSEAATIGPFDITPLPGNRWWLPDKFILKNITKNPVSFRYILDCWDERYCKDTQATITLAPGQTTQLGLGKICSKWQLDLIWTGRTDGKFDWGGISEKDPNANCNLACKVGFMYAAKDISSSGTGTGGYISRDTIKNARPDVQIVEFDLYRNNNPLEDRKLAELGVLFVTDYPSPYTPNPWPTNELMTDFERGLIKQAYTKGLDVVVAGDNGPVGGQDAAAIVGPLTNALQPSMYYGNEGNYFASYITATAVNPAWGPVVDMMSGAKIDTSNTGLYTPAYIRRGSELKIPVSCYYQTQLTAARTNAYSCLFSHVPRLNGSGFLVIDGNAGRPSSSVMKKIIDEGCAR